MKLSIITITYNSEKTISETLESVAIQTYKDFEHIIIDGNSSDNTISICNSFPHVSKIISEPDKGVYDAFNKGLKISTGEIIGFLNSDDILASTKVLEKIIGGFNENIDCIFGNVIYVNNQNDIIRVWNGSKFKKNNFAKGWVSAHPTFYCRKNIYEKYGFYKTNYKIAADVELMLRFLEVHKVSSSFISETLVVMKDGGISNNGLISKWIIFKEVIRAHHENNLKINIFLYALSKVKKLKQFILR